MTRVARRRPFGMKTPYRMTSMLPGTAKATALMNHVRESISTGQRDRIAALNTATTTVEPTIAMLSMRRSAPRESRRRERTAAIEKKSAASR